MRLLSGFHTVSSILWVWVCVFQGTIPHTPPIHQTHMHTNALLHAYVSQTQIPHT